MSRFRTPLIALAAALALPAAATADTLETPQQGATNLAGGGGYQAWSAKNADGIDVLQVRRPDRTVVTPLDHGFPGPVDPSIGTLGGVDGVNTLASKRLSVVYSSCTTGPRRCDVAALDLATMREAKVRTFAKADVEETAPSVASGIWTVVLRGGSRNGTYSYSTRGGFEKLSSRFATETATTTSRSAYVVRTGNGYGVQVKRSSNGKGGLVPVAGLKTRPRSLQLTRYRAGWLVPEAGATHVFQTKRFAGSGGPFILETNEADRTLPAGVTSAAGGASTLFDRYLDATGVKRLDPGIR